MSGYPLELAGDLILDRIQVIYIAGAGRTGTTLLDNVLGQIDGFFSGGELVSIWRRSFLQNRLCGCGDPFRSCSLWRAIAGPGLGKISDERAQYLADMVPRVRSMPGMLAPGSDRRVHKTYGPLLDAVDRLYRSITETTGSRVIVDSSKYPSYGLLLSSLPSLEVHVVHMIRDPRGVAFSWSRKKPSPAKGPGQFMTTHGPFNSAVLWNIWNLEAEALRTGPLASYEQLRYEDFMASPAAAVRTILDAARISKACAPRFTDHSVVLRPSHTVSGNPSRMKTGPTNLRADTEWVAEMRPRDRRLVEFLTGPLMFRYGYRIKQSGLQRSDE